MDLQPSSMPQPWNLLQIKTSQLQQGLSFLPPCTSPAAVATPAAAAAQQTFPSDLRSDPAQPCSPPSLRATLQPSEPAAVVVAAAGAAPQ